MKISCDIWSRATTNGSHQIGQAKLSFQYLHFTHIKDRSIQKCWQSLRAMCNAIGTDWNFSITYTHVNNSVHYNSLNPESFNLTTYNKLLLILLQVICMSDNTIGNTENCADSQVHILRHMAFNAADK
jgi:hypothetical protein